MIAAIRRRMSYAVSRRRHQRRFAGRRLLRAFADVHPQAFFVEIGANDGQQHDHLRPLILAGNWSGIMVEPVPYVFQRLRQNYSGIDRVVLVNAAVADTDGRLPFYYLTKPREDELERLPDWYDGIGSFSRDAVLSHADHIPDIEDRIICAEVPSFTFESLCSEHGAENVDLLVIDAEGYDREILRSIDFSRRRPELLVYEHFHLDPAGRAECRQMIEAAGYSTMEEGFDTWCLRGDSDARLRKTWSGLRPGVPGVAAYEQ